jgi:26S proteasome regulatory subunit T5
MESQGFPNSEQISDEIRQMSPIEIQQRITVIENEVRSMRQQHERLQHELTNLNEKVKDNNEKIKLNKQLPYLVANVVEVRMFFDDFFFLKLSFILDFRVTCRTGESKR